MPKKTQANDKKRKASTKRVQFDFSEESLARLDELREATGAATRAELLRRALMVFTKCLEASQDGAEVYFEKDDKRTMIIVA